MWDGIYSCDKQYQLPWKEREWKDAEQISVLVTCSGTYGKYVEKCLKSVYEQTYPNFEVLLIDDCTDNLPNLSTYKLRYFKVDYKNANKTRNFAVKQAKGKYIIYIDADDFLYDKFVLSKLASYMEDDVDIVAGHFKTIDSNNNDCTVYSFPKQFDRERLFHYNYIQTTSLIRRKGFVGWDESLEQFQDWDMYVHSINSGKKIKYIPEFALYYVRHGENMQNRYVTRWKERGVVHYLSSEDYKNIYRDILYKNMVLTIATSFSGKTWCFDKYFKRLSELNFPKDRTRLVLFDDSNNAKFSKMLKNKLKKIRSKYKYTTILYGGVRPMSYEAYPVPRHMSEIYNRMRYEMIQGTHCYIWEDDEIPPKDVIYRLSRLIWSDVGVASGFAKSRQEKKPLVWYWDNSKDWGLSQAFPNGKETEEVSAVGLGCALFPSMILRDIAFRPTGEKGEVGHDIVFCRDISRQRFKIMVDWNVRCQHLDRSGVITPKIKLHLGCGYHHKKDFINIDKMMLHTVDQVHDLAKPLPFPNDSVDLIETHHLIEHIPTHLGTKGYIKDFVPILKDWHRVLNGNGKIVIECPDFDALITLYNKKPRKRDELLKHIYGYGGDNQYHYMGWNFNRLKTVLHESGFTNIVKRKARDYHAKQSPCLRVEATK